MAIRGFILEICMGELDRQISGEKTLRIVAIVVAVMMLATFLSLGLTGLSLYTAICAVLLMLSTMTLLVMDMAR